MDLPKLSTDDPDRLPGDPTPAEIAELCRIIREVGFQPTGKGRQYHPPWPEARYCNSRPRDDRVVGQLRVICVADLGPGFAHMAAEIAKITLSLS